MSRILGTGEFSDRCGGSGGAVIIAEAGVNHNGSTDLAHLLVDTAANAGADVVKFQTFTPELVIAAGAPTANYQRDRAAATDQLDMVRSLTLPRSAWAELADHARERNLLFLSTAFDTPSADLLQQLGMPAFKVPSGEVTNTPFIRDLAQRGLPLLLSTGTADLAEVAAAVEAASDAPQVVLLQCVSSYPAPVSTANLRTLTTMREHFGLPVGWSDHTTGELTAIAAVALGASVIEKHLTLDRGMAGPDHAASADPMEFGRYVVAIRTTEMALGNGIKSPSDIELDVRAIARRSWHATRDLPSGHQLTPDDVVALRPGTGIAPAVTVVGWVTLQPLANGEMLDPALLVEPS